MEDRSRDINRLHREMTIVFPEYKTAFGKIDGAFTVSVLEKTGIPFELATLGEDGIRAIWHEEKLRGAGYRRARFIAETAAKCVGLKEGLSAHRKAICHWAEQIRVLTEKIDEVENAITSPVRKECWRYYP